MTGKSLHGAFSCLVLMSLSMRYKITTITKNTFKVDFRTAENGIYFFLFEFNYGVNQIGIQFTSFSKIDLLESVLLLKREESPGSNGQTTANNKKRTENVRSLSANLKFPYKRTVSAPGGMGLSAKTSNVSAPSNINSNISYSKLLFKL